MIRPTRLAPLAFVGLALAARAKADAPTVYSATELLAMMGPSLTMEIHRNGEKAVVELKAQNGRRTRTFYDLDSGRTFTWDPSAPNGKCTEGSMQGDFDDPFTKSETLTQNLSGLHPAELGTTTLNGFAVRIVEADNQMGKGRMKLWIDKSGLVVRFDSSDDRGGMQTRLNLKRLERHAPAASAFVLSAPCAKLAARP